MNESTEIQEMEQRERKRWLTVAEGQRLRSAWDKTRQTMDEIAEKYDADPESENEAMVYLLIATLTLDALSRQAVEGVKKLQELMPRKDGE